MTPLTGTSAVRSGLPAGLGGGSGFSAGQQRQPQCQQADAGRYPPQARWRNARHGISPQGPPSVSSLRKPVPTRTSI